MTQLDLHKQWKHLVRAIRWADRPVGAGIASDALPHVCDRFYRGDPTRSQQRASRGWGLPSPSPSPRRTGDRSESRASLGAGRPSRCCCRAADGHSQMIPFSRCQLQADGDPAQPKAIFADAATACPSVAIELVTNAASCPDLTVKTTHVMIPNIVQKYNE